VIGKHGLGKKSDNGERFLELCANHNMVIGGSLFKHKNCHKGTWNNPSNGKKNQIDHIAISKNFRNSLLDVRVFNSACCGSDHDLLVGKIQIKLRSRRTETQTSSRPKYNVHFLQNGEHRSRFVEKFSTNLQNSNPGVNDPINTLSDKLKNALLDAADEILGPARKKRDEFISSETWQKIMERKELKLETLPFGESCPERLKVRRNELNRTIRKMINEDKKAAIESLALDAERASERGDTKEVFRITAKLASDEKSVCVPIKDKDGVALTSTADQAERFREHFSDLLNNNNLPPLPPDERRRTRQLRSITTDAPTIDEIVKALKDLKNGKAAGSDGLPAELLKADENIIARAFYPFFRKVWTDETFPDDWLEGRIVKILKKGDLSNVNNWRGIMVLSAPSKIFNRIVYNRLIGELDPSIRPEQAGFRPNHSCIDQICSLRIIIEQSIEYQSPLFIVFIDFKKAFDSINREAIWRALINRGVPEKIVNLIKRGYEGFNCRVQHQNVMSQPFQTITGVRQGCLLSPLLFLLVLDDIMRKTLQNCGPRGLQWQLFGDRLEDLDFADDIALVSHTHSDMQAKLSQLVAESAKVGLELNVSKTFAMSTGGTQGITPFSVNGNVIEWTDHFEYLGSFISKTDGGTEKDINSRITKAKFAFARLRRIWNMRQISTSTKISIFNSCVKSVLLYGSESWYVKDSMANKLKSFFNRCLRRILGVWWPRIISNQTLYEKTNQMDINKQIKVKKYRWIGHTLRKEKKEICYKALLWNPIGTRKVGAPKRTWRNSIQRECGGKSIATLTHLANVDKAKIGYHRNRTWKLFVKEICDIPTQFI
jgi:hypothetical protein